MFLFGERVSGVVRQRNDSEGVNVTREPKPKKNTKKAMKMRIALVVVVMLEDGVWS